MREFWATYRGNTVGPYKTREEAEDAFFANFAGLNRCMTGYGSLGPHFDMRFTKREEKAFA